MAICGHRHAISEEDGELGVDAAVESLEKRKESRADSRYRGHLITDKPLPGVPAKISPGAFRTAGSEAVVSPRSARHERRGRLESPARSAQIEKGVFDMQVWNRGLLGALPSGVIGPGYDRGVVRPRASRTSAWALFIARTWRFTWSDARAGEANWGILGINLLPQDRPLAEALQRRVALQPHRDGAPMAAGRSG